MSNFWDRVEKTDTCWLWKGPIRGTGYGAYSAKYAHRHSYELANPNFNKKMFVLHRCDVRLCVNPEHLFLGTAKDNTQDAVSKGRMNLGESNGMSKLTEKDVRIIKALKKKVSGKELAKQFNVLRTTITEIHTGRNWAWVKV